MNPELKRNLWLEMGLHRLIVAPVVILLVLGLLAAGVATGEDWRSPVYPIAIVLAILILHLWGSRQASEAVGEEVRDRTWDLQRLCALGPWEMTWGKLLGATVFPWYAGGICLAAMAITAPGAPERAPTGWLILAIAASAVMLHGAALGASLQSVRKNPKTGQRFGTLFLFAPVFLGLWLLSLSGAGELHRAIEWHGLSVERMAFIALSAVAFASWAVFGAYRGMCRELQVRTLPWAWPAFALFLAFWLAGLAGRESVGAARAFVAFGLVTSVALTYFALFAELTTAMGIRLVLVKAREGDWRRALEEIPVWPSTLLLGAIFALAAPFAFAGDAIVFAGMRVARLQQLAMHAPIALVLLAARDCAILVFFASAARPRRVEAATILYIVLLSWVVPGLLAALGLSGLAQILMPFATLDGPTAALVMAAQAAIAWGLAMWRWRANHGRMPSN